MLEAMPDGLLAIAIGMSRIIPCMIFIPLFQTRYLQGGLRNAIAVSLSLIIAPLNYQYIQENTIEGIEFGFFIFKEAILGFLLGFILAIPFWIFESVGSLLDNQRGALIGGQLNPGLNTESILGGMFNYAVGVLLIVTIGVPVLLDVIWASYQVWPATLWFPLPEVDAVSVWLNMISQMFIQMVLYAAPLVFPLMLIDFAMAIISLYSPQLNVFILSMPAKSFVGLALLAVYLPLLWDGATIELSKYFEIKNYLGYLLGVQ